MDDLLLHFMRSVGIEIREILDFISHIVREASHIYYYDWITAYGDRRLWGVLQVSQKYTRWYRNVSYSAYLSMLMSIDSLRS